ncbi:MAG: amidohydrolase family protein, partial [Dehalococcoidia bacterium]|nr:amidohydrolase family protein [Dehalococcoidia bacterium]
LRLVIATHDDDTIEKVEQQHAHGATICEFPVTIEAAERAHALGMHIVVGAPNVVRGGSHSGNLDAAVLFERGLADIICADYHAASLLPAAFKLVADGLTDLPTAIRALTRTPARAVGITDRGAIEAGQRADLLLVRHDRHGVPRVERAFRAGVLVFQIALAVSPSDARVRVDDGRAQ